MNQIDTQAKIAACIMAIVLLLIAIAVHGHADSNQNLGKRHAEIIR